MHEENHGHSAAAWTGVLVCLVGAVAACWAVVFGPGWLVWAGIGLFAAGGVIWYAMARAGMGSDPERSSRHAVSERTGA